MTVPKSLDGELERECIMFCTALVQSSAAPYVRSKYAAAHAFSPLLREADADPVDAMLLRAARSGQFSMRCADMYARFFRPHGVLRCKLVLLVAILENAPDSHALLNDTEQVGLARAFAGMAAAMAASAATLLIALLRFGPRHAGTKLGIARAEAAPSVAPEIPPLVLHPSAGTPSQGDSPQ